MKSIFKRVKLSKKDMFLVVGFILLSSVAEVSLPTLVSDIFDVGITNSDLSYITKIASIMIVLLFVGFVFGISARIISAKITAKFAADLRLEVFNKIQSFSSSEFDKFGTGSLITRSSADISTIQRFLGMTLRMGVMSPLMFVSGLVMATFTGLKLSKILLFSIPLLIISSLFVVHFLLKYFTKIREILDRINKLFLEKLEGIRVIRAFNKQRYEIKKFDVINNEYMFLSRNSGRIAGSIFPLINLIFGITTTLVMALGARYVASGEIEIGVLIANTQYMAIILFSIVILMMIITQFPLAQACMNRIAEVLDTPNSIKDGFVTDKAIDGANVEFKNVSFKYENAEGYVLNDISFVAKKGEITSIIGSTGSGKSTVLKLIPRFYDISEGEISINGTDIKDYTLETLNGLISYVPQKSVLFSGTISSNIDFAGKGASIEEISKASETACASEFIMTKEGSYDYEVSQGGNNLSGGQKQRIAIARAILKDAPIFLFDDSFSALDMKTDRQIRKNLRMSMVDKAVIIVAQRISSIMDSEKIIVLDKGKIAGQGTHKELLQNCEVYREIAVLQLGEEALDV